MTDLRIYYTDGDTQIIATDDSWKSFAGNSAFPYTGDVHDAEAISWVGFKYPFENVKAENYPSGFQEINFNDSKWQYSNIKPPLKNLVGYPAENLKKEIVTPVSVKKLQMVNFYLIMD